jgi:hypothetical protein
MEKSLLHSIQAQYNQRQKKVQNILNISFSQIVDEYFDIRMVTGPRL